jgi:hypothetical protein
MAEKSEQREQIVYPGNGFNQYPYYDVNRPPNTLKVKDIQDYQRKVMSGSSELWETKEFTDFVIVTKKGEIPCHSLILRAHCPFIKAMLELDSIESKKRRVTIDYFPAEVVEKIVEFIYCGVVTIPPHMMEDVVFAADYLQVENMNAKLLEACDHRYGFFRPPNVLRFREIAEHIKSADLAMAVKRKIVSMFHGIMQSESFLNLDPVETGRLIKEMEVDRVYKDYLVDGILRWMHHATNDDPFEWLSDEDFSYLVSLVQDQWVIATDVDEVLEARLYRTIWDRHSQWLFNEYESYQKQTECSPAAQAQQRAEAVAKFQAGKPKEKSKYSEMFFYETFQQKLQAHLATKGSDNSTGTSSATAPKDDEAQLSEESKLGTVSDVAMDASEGSGIVSSASDGTESAKNSEAAKAGDATKAEDTTDGPTNDTTTPMDSTNNEVEASKENATKSDVADAKAEDGTTEGPTKDTTTPMDLTNNDDEASKENAIKSDDADARVEGESTKTTPMDSTSNVEASKDDATKANGADASVEVDSAQTTPMDSAINEDEGSKDEEDTSYTDAQFDRLLASRRFKRAVGIELMKLVDKSTCSVHYMDLVKEILDGDMSREKSLPGGGKHLVDLPEEIRTSLLEAYSVVEKTRKEPYQAQHPKRLALVGGCKDLRNTDNTTIFVSFNNRTFYPHASIPSDCHPRYSVFCETPEGVMATSGKHDNYYDMCNAYNSDTSHYVSHQRLLIKKDRHAMAYVNDRIYVLGGYCHSMWYVQVEFMDTRDMQWHFGPDLPEPFESPRAVTIGTSIYVMHGYKKMAMLDVVGMLWVECAPLPDEATGAGIATDGELIYVAGGTGAEIDTGPKKSTGVRGATAPKEYKGPVCFRYTPATDTWETLSPPNYVHKVRFGFPFDRGRN